MADDKNVKAEQLIRLDWDASPKLREEFFNDYELFAAFKRDNPGVRVKQLGTPQENER